MVEARGGVVYVGRGMMDLRRAEALSGIVVVSMAGTTKIMQIFTLKISHRFVVVTASVACA
jgi:hypothetical protein